MGMSSIVFYIFYEVHWRDFYDEEDGETYSLFERMGEVPWSMGSLASFVEYSCDDLIVAIEIEGMK